MGGWNRWGVIFLLWTLSRFADGADLGGGGDYAGLCASCHGSRGQSSSPMTPSLAGQQASYIILQLKAYQEGRRRHAAMESVISDLSDADMSLMAAYYAGQKPMRSKGNAAFATKGKVLYAQCKECHGAGGAGQGVNSRLAGQQAPYLSEQLKAYKEGRRRNSVMNVIAATLSEADIRALSEYLATLK
ncbi:MAG TPA: cytochrome c [Candidatus Manganitrophaceae bacterium]|nr:cytochrome c [Candidatus Manganitrophaceae bacterium]